MQQLELATAPFLLYEIVIITAITNLFLLDSIQHSLYGFEYQCIMKSKAEGSIIKGK